MNKLFLLLATLWLAGCANLANTTTPGGIPIDASRSASTLYACGI